MKKEQELMDLFKVEELEKRYEMGWIKSTTLSTSTSFNPQTGVTQIVVKTSSTLF